MEALKTSKKNEKQKGGFVIAPWLAALTLSAGVKVTERVFDFIADKMQGKGMKKPKTVAEIKTIIIFIEEINKTKVIINRLFQKDFSEIKNVF